MVKLRLQRAGRKYLPFYRIVAASVKNATNYKPLEKLGTYNPIPDRSGNKHVALKTERIMYWIMNGAQPTDTVAKLLARASLVPPAPHRRGALPDPENKWLKEALADGDEVDTYQTDPNNSDTDGDGLDDGDELNSPNPTDPNNSDTDGDNLSDGDELNSLNPTDPNDSDSDDDGLADGQEVETHQTDPLLEDSDNDGVNDKDELEVYQTNPNARDSDNDGMIDGQEILNGTDPLNADSDGDGYSDGEESQRSDPLDASSIPTEDEEVKSGCSTSTHPVESVPILLILAILSLSRRKDKILR